jgi:predicted transcriptional regulator
MTKAKKLTPTEWEIMEAIWEMDSSPSVRDVLEYRFPNGEKAYTTVQTIMNTLEKKGILSRKKIGLVNFYTPVITREKMVNAEVSSLLKRLFDGSVPALANYLIHESTFDLSAIDDIKILLAEKEKALKEKKS